MEIENIFISMLLDDFDDLFVTKKLPKNKFIGKYIQKLNEIDKSKSKDYKSPQVIGHGGNSKDNWIDYILDNISSDEETLKLFKKSLTEI